MGFQRILFKRKDRAALWACVGALLFPFVGIVGTAVAQESYRPSDLGNRAYDLRSTSPETKNYNLKLGPVFFDARSLFEVEFNDNVGISENNRESDIALRPGVAVDAEWQVTQVNRLSLTLGLGYSKYLNHSDLDTQGLLVSPGSALAFDVYIGDFRINFHDYISVLQNPVDDASLSNVANFQRIQNSLGVSVLWDLNDLKLVLGYDHFNFWSIDDEYDYLDRAEDSVYFSASLDLNDANRIGFDASTGDFSYQQDYNNDGLGYSAGMFWETQVTNFIRARVAGGFQSMLFGGGGDNGDGSDFNGWYGNATIAHRLNAYWTHSLALGHEARLGLGVNFNEYDYVRYIAAWRMNRVITLNMDAFYEHSNESGGEFQTEVLDRWGGGVGFSYQLNRRSALSVRYAYVNKDSDLPLRSYYQNRLILGISYDF